MSSLSLSITTILARRFRSSETGNSAVEFALIAPILIILVVGITDIGKIAFDRTDMFSAARSGAQYFMSGGTDLARAREVVLSAWSGAPEDAVITIDRFCQCAGTDHACNTPCPDTSAPDAFARISLSAVVRGIFLEYVNLASDTIRIR